MPEKNKLKLWHWLLLFLLGFFFPLYNILINSFLSMLQIQTVYYLLSVMLTTVIFSCILFLTLNFFRRKTNFDKRMDTAFMLYVLSVSFGSFFRDLSTGIGLFILPFLIAYFMEIRNILDNFPRE